MSKEIYGATLAATLAFGLGGCTPLPEAPPSGVVVANTETSEDIFRTETECGFHIDWWGEGDGDGWKCEDVEVLDHTEPTSTITINACKPVTGGFALIDAEYAPGSVEFPSDYPLAALDAMASVKQGDTERAYHCSSTHEIPREIGAALIPGVFVSSTKELIAAEYPQS